MARQTLPQLPQLLERKLSKTGQTRGADDDEIYQNRVNRNSTVLIPYQEWQHVHIRIKEIGFEKGYIVLIPPNIEDTQFEPQGLRLGDNCLYFFQTRHEWDRYNPERRHLHIATTRTPPLGGEYVARVPATTATNNGDKINRGFTGRPKGAGIRFYEYANANVIKQCRLQLEALFWHCHDALESVIHAGMSQEDAETRKQEILNQARDNALLDYTRLKKIRILDKENMTICPLCLKRISGRSFMTRLTQAEGRETPDLTITEVSLFHIEELRPGQFNHRPYNLGWGHHHCNVVVKDSGIMNTLIWLKSLIKRNIKAGVDIPDQD
jgi:hypothetical protein